MENQERCETTALRRKKSPDSLSGHPRLLATIIAASVLSVCGDVSKIRAPVSGVSPPPRPERVAADGYQALMYRTDEGFVYVRHMPQAKNSDESPWKGSIVVEATMPSGQKISSTDFPVDGTVRLPPLPAIPSLVRIRCSDGVEAKFAPKGRDDAGTVGFDQL